MFLLALYSFWIVGYIIMLSIHIECILFTFIPSSFYVVPLSFAFSVPQEYLKWYYWRCKVQNVETFSLKWAGSFLPAGLLSLWRMMPCKLLGKSSGFLLINDCMLSQRLPDEMQTNGMTITGVTNCLLIWGPFHWRKFIPEAVHCFQSPLLQVRSLIRESNAVILLNLKSVPIKLPCKYVCFWPKLSYHLAYCLLTLFIENQIS